MNVEQFWRLNGYKAVVTGGSKGIGRAVVEELLDLGAEVLSVALEEGEARVGLRQVVLDLGEVGWDVRLLQALPAGWRGIDILVNNAGMNIRKPTLKYAVEEYARIWGTNVTAVYEMCRLLHGPLRASGRGSVVNVGSVAGMRYVGSGSAYAMSKAAVAHLSSYLAAEWAQDGIRVNAVAPGWAKTPLTVKVQESEGAMAAIAGQTPMGRMGEAGEIARVIAFLCMPAASYVSGAVVPVDGGMSGFCMDVGGLI
jgi:tropinone reductase I